MKRTLALIGLLALSFTPVDIFAHHLKPNEREIRPGGNLIHTNLRGRNLSGVNLSGANLFKADLSGTNLSGANLSNANLSSLGTINRTNLSNANLSNANLYRATMYKSNLSGANFSGAELWGANFLGADLSNADFSGTDLKVVSFGGNLMNGFKANNLKGCKPINGWVCKNKSLIKKTEMITEREENIINKLESDEYFLYFMETCSEKKLFYNQIDKLDEKVFSCEEKFYDLYQ
tara:strand:- start:27 stop:728 length:702 start_codon:yes stop_codon:yes gene_type:complete